MRSEKASKVRTVAIAALVLDRENPRLVGSDPRASDEAIIGRLYRTAELEELLHSISANGYLDIEPLVVMPDGSDVFTVLEGNRRLATLRLLTDHDLVRRIRQQEGFTIGIPDVEPSLRSTFERVTIHQVASRADARPFIGFKHINGPAKWNAYAKAKFAADWYRHARKEDKSISIQEIARSIGDRHDTIKRMIFAIYVLEQAEEADVFAVGDRYTKKFNFSHLYTALTRKDYMTFLGIKGSWSDHDPNPHVVPETHLTKLGEVLRWIYGSRSDDVRPVVRVQNPHIKQLGDILANTEAVHILRRKADIKSARAATEPASTRFTTALLSARENLHGASKALRGYNELDDALLDVAEDNKEIASSIYLRMKEKYENRESS